MNRFFGCIIFNIALLLNTYVFSSERHTSMNRDLETIKGIFKEYYAPAEWKKKSFGWDLDEEIEKAKAHVLENEEITLKEFHKILRDFFNSTRDHHAQILFFSTESASLPFCVKSAENRYFFVYVDKDRLSPFIYPIEEGDELVLFDGRPTSEVINEIKAYTSGSNPATVDAFAEMSLTLRFGMLGHEVPRGPIEIQVRHCFTDKLSTYQLIWDYTPEKITFRYGNMNDFSNDRGVQGTKLLDHPFFNRKMLFPIYETWKETNLAKNCKHFLGSKQSFVPILGKVWWTAPTTSHFSAYLFETDSHKLVGYLRIPYYFGNEETLEDFASIIDFFESRSDALVIDQVNNPGGSLFYLYALASMLTEQPLKTPKHRQKISQSELFLANFMIPLLESVGSDEDAKLILGYSHEGNEVTYQMAKFFLNYMYFLVEEWNAGRQFTNPYYLEGMDNIHPHPSSRFTKPILLLTNAMDMSGGDFLPAILQDNKRAVIFGERTAGAGGYLLYARYPNLNGIMMFNLTESIAERVDSIPIENLGVTPDVSYSLTVEDIQFGYEGYKEAVLRALQDIL